MIDPHLVVVWVKIENQRNHKRKFGILWQRAWQYESTQQFQCYCSQKNPLISWIFFFLFFFKDIHLLQTGQLTHRMTFLQELERVRFHWLVETGTLYHHRQRWESGGKEWVITHEGPFGLHLFNFISASFFSALLFVISLQCSKQNCFSKCKFVSVELR